MKITYLADLKHVLDMLVQQATNHVQTGDTMTTFSRSAWAEKPGTLFWSKEGSKKGLLNTCAFSAACATRVQQAQSHSWPRGLQ